MQGDRQDILIKIINFEGTLGSTTISTFIIITTTPTTTMIFITTTTTMIFPGLWQLASPPSAVSPPYSLQTLASSSLLTPSKCIEIYDDNDDDSDIN